MADNITGKTEVAAVSQTLISSIVQDELIQKSILLGCVSDYSALATKGSDTVKIPRTGSFTATAKAENTAMDAQALTMAGDSITLDQHYAVQALIEKFAEVQSNVNLFGEYLKRMGSALALKVDQVIYAALAATSASSPDHRLAYAGATIAAADILGGRKLLRIQNLPMDNDVFVGISPATEADVMALSDFVDASKWASGSENVKSSGFIGKLYGMNVIVTNCVADSRAVVWHRSHVGFALQAAPEYQTQLDLANLATRISLDHIYGVKTMDSGKRGVLLGSAT